MNKRQRKKAEKQDIELVNKVLRFSKEVIADIFKGKEDWLAEEMAKPSFLQHIAKEDMPNFQGSLIRIGVKSGGVR